jgi:hypothetical protein
MKEKLVTEILGTAAHRILVVTGYRQILDSFAVEQFPGRELLVNKDRYFGWLLKVCEYARFVESSLILVSPYPRLWNPPRIRVVHASGLVAHADGSIPGDIFDIDTTAVARATRQGERSDGA